MPLMMMMMTVSHAEVQYGVANVRTLPTAEITNHRQYNATVDRQTLTRAQCRVPAPMLRLYQPCIENTQVLVGEYSTVQ